MTHPFIKETDEQKAAYSPEQREYNAFLDMLRESGICNMFEGPKRLREEYPELDKRSSFEAFETWTKRF